MGLTGAETMASALWNLTDDRRANSFMPLPVAAHTLYQRPGEGCKRAGWGPTVGLTVGSGQ